ncbi:hypothetical protein H9L13_00050 [Sphingomonas lutea]|uniref:Uncharacterized protein n=1 Tax=Sphingomonas lutea TaxID=1045317 RepID=A0A7G9SHT4_9SPHN|nr:hypothetical protein [Sphingomonas lutea]QNN67409.1 hypothetical protein H9L13_00050 [Sphingomonas lutea]
MHGGSDRLYRDGELVAERRKPSDRLLMWLLSHHNPETYGWAARPNAGAPNVSFFPTIHARRELPGALDALTDIDRSACPAEGLVLGDFHAGDDPPPRA